MARRIRPGPAPGPPAQVPRAERKVSTGDRNGHTTRLTGVDGIMSLQQTAGNQAVSSMLQVQRDLITPSLFLTNRQKIDRALKSNDVGDVKDITNFSEATPPERLKLIAILLDQFWVGPLDEYALEDLWGTFGSGVLDVARDNSGLWTQSLERGAELYKLPAAKVVSDQFISDVRAVAGSHLDSNETYCNDELKRIGADPAGGAPPPDSAAHLAELQGAAKTIVQAKDGQKRLLGVQVGWEACHEETGYHEVCPVTFHPGSPPPQTGMSPPPGSPETVRYEDAQSTHETFQAVIDGLTAKYPVLYSVLQGDNLEAAGTMSESPDQAFAVVNQTLSGVLQHIRETRPKVAGDLAFELQPIHGQLFAGQVSGPSGIDWKNPVAQALGQQVLEGHSEENLLRDLGISTLAAAAFIAAEFVTGGLATFALVAAGMSLGITQAAMAWDKAYELAQAHGASTTKDTELVSEGQVTMATVEAVLNTALVFVDAAIALKTLGRLGATAATLAGRRAAAEAIESLARLSSLAPAEAAAAIERGVTELGVESVIERTGKSATELLGVVGESSGAAARLKAFAALPENLARLSAGELGEQLAKLSALAKTDAAAAEALAVAGVERLGPMEVVRRAGGWRELSMLLGNESVAGKAIMAWRDGMFTEIEAFVRTLPGGVDEAGNAAVKRTGSLGKFTNDFDISLLGPKSSANRDAVRAFMAARAGVAEDQLGTLLLADFFTDPRRLHLYDLLKPELRAEIAKRAERTAEANIFAKTLSDAEKAGNKELAAQLREQMKALGVEEVPFKPLGEADRSALYTKMDDLHTKLEEAVKNGDEAAQKQLAGEIGDTQGLINAAEGGGYFSGGATSQLVTKPEGLLAPGAEVLDAQKYTALLDQLPKLYGESNTLLRTGFVAGEDAVGAIKGVAKYGNRFRQLMSDLGVQVAEEGKWNSLAERFQKLLHQAKGEADVTLLERLSSDAAGVEAEVSELLDEFATSSQDVLVKLSQQAALQNVPADLARLQLLTMLNARLLRTSAAIKTAMIQASSNMGRMAVTVGSSSGGASQQ
jgi:hypothetical protein